MARGDPRVLILALPVSLVASIVLLAGAWAHRVSAVARDAPGWGAHLAAEILLWGGLVLSMLVFAAAFALFRRDVRVAKAAGRVRQQKLALLEELRKYERDDQIRMNN